MPYGLSQEELDEVEQQAHGELAAKGQEPTVEAIARIVQQVVWIQVSKRYGLTHDESAYCIERGYQVGWDENKNPHIFELSSGESIDNWQQQRWTSWCGADSVEILRPWTWLDSILRCDECLNKLRQTMHFHVTRV